MKKCNDCGAKPGGFHERGCDVERCPFCGGQLISCRCAYEFVFAPTSTGSPSYTTPALWEEHLKSHRLPWTGEWPGVAECREYDLWAKFIPGRGWVECKKDDEGATEDLNRLYGGFARWDRTARRWIRIERG